MIEEKFAGSNRLGASSAQDVFVTTPDQLVGLNAQGIAQKLTLKNPDGSTMKGPFRLIEFDTPAEGLAQPYNRTNPGFLNGGRTAGGATEYVIPNSEISSLENVTQKTVK